MDFNTLILPLGTSLLIGALIGLEREKSKQRTKGRSAVGIRTDMLISLFGAIAAFLGKTYSPVLFLVCLGAMLILTISSYIYLSITRGRVGFTTELSTILVFLFGAMAMAGYIQLAVILAIVVTIILSLRGYLHKAIYNISSLEIADTLKFAIITFIVLPFLPNQNYDQQVFHFLFPNAQTPAAFNQIDILNPYRIWLLVVLVSGISFLGYILVKIIGKKKGISMAGLIGGLYSSTATSLTLARKSKLYKNIQRPFVTGIVLACGISFLRTFIELRTLNEQLFLRTIVPLSLMFAYLMIVGFVLFISKKEEKITHEDEFKTPFELKEALKLGGFIIGALLLAKVLLSYVGIDYYYIVSAGLALFAIDDPIVISTATSAGSLISYDHAKNVIIMVTLLNMVQKVGLVYFFGNRKLFKSMVLIFGGLVIVSAVGFIF